jgi:hypothetical protein
MKIRITLLLIGVAIIGAGLLRDKPFGTVCGAITAALAAWSIQRRLAISKK